MTSRGKHASRGPGTFYRDLAVMILGILVVGAAVFFLLYLFADRPVTVAETTTTTVADTTTTAEGDTTITTVETTTTTTPDTTTTSGVVAVRPPAEVTVVVLNSTTLDGAAGRLTSQLADAGYQTLPPDNFSPEQNPSRIWYRNGYAAEGAALLEHVAGATVETLPDESVAEGADIVVVIGTGYTE